MTPVLRSAVVLVLIALSLPASPVVGQNAQRLLPVGDEFYELVDYLYLDAGLVPPSRALPYTVDEARRNLARIDRRRLEGPAAAAYDEAAGRLTRTADHREGAEGEGFAARVRPVVTAEAYFQSNPDNSDWVYDGLRRLPLVSIPIELYFFDSIAMRTDLDLRKDLFLAGGDDDNRTNLMLAAHEIDLNIPYRANMSVGGDHWNILAGRERLSWGNGRTGNLLLSGDIDYHDALRFTTYWGWFKLTFLAANLESWPFDFGSGDFGAAGGTAIPDPTPGDDNPAVERFKMFLAHRFEFRIFDVVQFALTESIVYGGKYPDPRVFNPLNIYHNLYIKENANSLISLEMEWAPLPGLLLYGQFAMDQFSTAYERAVYGPDEEPNAMGFLAGAEYRAPVADGLGRVSVEWARTDPWLYLRETSMVSFVSIRRRHSESAKVVGGGKGHYYDWQPLGYYLGPDAMVASAYLEWKRPGWLTLYGEYRLVLHGENYIYSDFQTGDRAVKLDSPSGTVDTRHIATLGAAYHPFPGQELGLEATFMAIGNQYNDPRGDRLDFQLAAYYRYEF